MFGLPQTLTLERFQLRMVRNFLKDSSKPFQTNGFNRVEIPFETDFASKIKTNISFSRIMCQLYKFYEVPHKMFLFIS